MMLHAVFEPSGSFSENQGISVPKAMSWRNTLKINGFMDVN